MSQEIELLREIRDLLAVMAEPAIASRDKKLRESLRTAVGASKKAQACVLMMDGSRSQKDISTATGFDQGSTSKLVKKLIAEKLLDGTSGNPKLLIKLPQNFFDLTGGEANA